MSKILLEKRNKLTHTGANHEHMTARGLIDETELNSTGTPDLFVCLREMPGAIEYALGLFLSEFDYAGNKKSNRAIALRIQVFLALWIDQQRAL